MRQLKDLDQFVSEGVMIQDNNCDFASPLAIVNKKDGGIRMVANYFAKVDNLWGYHLLKLVEDSSKVTAIITPWVVYRFLACPFDVSTAPG